MLLISIMWYSREYFKWIWHHCNLSALIKPPTFESDVPVLSSTRIVHVPVEIALAYVTGDEKNNVRQTGLYPFTKAS